MTERMTRRTVVQGAVIAGVGGSALVACGTAEPKTTSTQKAEVNSADVPVGGGTVLPGAKVVFVQPASGEFKAYSAVCPHQKCVFTEVADGAIKCGGCHKAEFAIADGTNTAGPNGGPANLPALEELTIKIAGDTISVG